MKFYSRLIRPFGVSEAVVEDYSGLSGILPFFHISIEPKTERLVVDAEDKYQASSSFRRLQHYYKTLARIKELKVKELVLEDLF